MQVFPCISMSFSVGTKPNEGKCRSLKLLKGNVPVFCLELVSIFYSNLMAVFNDYANS